MTSPARAVALRAPAKAPAPSQPSRGLLRLVPQRRSQAARTPFAVVLVLLLGGGLLGLLLLNTLVAQDSFRLHDLAGQSRALQLREQQLQGQLQAVKAPSRLAERATALGMVPGGPPAFLRVSDGKVLGKATKGVAAPKPVVTPDPTTKPGTTTTAATKPGTTSGAKPATRTRTAPASGTTWTPAGEGTAR